MVGSSGQPSSDAAPVVSVVISTRNRSQLLPAALRALLAQEPPAGGDYEIIVVDNGSSDSTREVIEAFIGGAKGRLRRVWEPRPGVSYGRNAGIKAARAPIVAFTDDDNVVGPGWVATIKSVMDECPGAAATGGKILPEWGGDVPSWLDRNHWSPLAILDYGDKRFYTSPDDPRCLLTANLAVRREFFDRVGGFSPDFLRCQDHEWLIRLWRSGERALYAPELVVRAPVSPDRLTREYHRAWHSQHGYYSAAMHLEEIVDANGRMHFESSRGPQLLGVPPHLFAEVFRAVRRSVLSLMRGDRALALRGVYHVRYLMAYIRRTVRDRRPTGTGISDTIALLTSRLRDRFRVSAISVPRVMFVHVLMAVLVGGSLYDMKTGEEHWPLSPYPMFSIVERHPAVRCLRVVGVTAGSTPRELLLLENELIHPFDQCRLTSAFSRAYTDDRRRPVIREQLRDCLARYEARRKAGEHEGPELRAVRLYDMAWTLDPDASNVDKPDTRRLVEEVDSATPPAAF